MRENNASFGGPDRVRQKLGILTKSEEKLPTLVTLAQEHGWHTKLSEPGTDGNASRWTFTRGTQSASVLIRDKWKWVEDPWLPAGPVTRDRPGVGVHRFGDDFIAWLTAPGPIDDLQEREQAAYDADMERVS